jgi:N-acetylglutamate synthase-like GNAT family acetyltransferase
VVIRTATPVDSDAVSVLLETSYSLLLGGHYDSRTLELALPYMVKANPTLLTSGTYYVQEVRPGTIVGCGGWTREKPGSNEIVEGEAHIRHLAVHPDWTNRGTGKALITRCINDAKSVGIHKLHCFSTLNAERFYRTCGFRSIEKIDVQMGQTVTFPCILMQFEIL